MMNVEQSRRKQFEVFELGGRELLHQGELGLPDCLPATVSPLTSSSTYSAQLYIEHLLPTRHTLRYCRKLRSGLFSSLQTHTQTRLKVEMILQEQIPTTFGSEDTAHICTDTQVILQPGTQAPRYLRCPSAQILKQGSQVEAGSAV